MTGAAVARISTNKDLFLLPGTFGHLRLFGGNIAALLIPHSAFVSDQASKIVFTVTPENKIAVKQVQFGQIHEGLRVVLSGLDQNDQIVIDGLARRRRRGRGPRRAGPD